MNNELKVSDIAELLARDSRNFCLTLLPNGKITKNGSVMVIGNVHNEPGDSMQIQLTGERAGKFHDKANPECRGDLIQLTQDVMGCDFPSAMKYAKDYLRLPDDFKTQKIAKKVIAAVPEKYDKPRRAHKYKLDKNSGAYEYLTETRKLDDKTLNDYGVTTDGLWMVFTSYKDNQAVRLKKIHRDLNAKGKKRIDQDDNCEPCLFGMNVIPNTVKELFITEGEIDALTMYQYGFTAVSGYAGSGCGGWIEPNYDWLARFEKIYICYDDDDAGKTGALALAKRLGNDRCYNVIFPKNDANECLKSGVTKNVIERAVYDARRFDDKATIRNMCVAREAFKRQRDGVQELGEYYSMFGKRTEGNVRFKPQQTILWTGVTMHGKSQFLSHLIVHQMAEGAKFLVMSLEMSMEELTFRFTNQVGGLSTGKITDEYCDAIHDWYRDKLWFYDKVGTEYTYEIIEVMEYVIKRFGIDVFVIDSLFRIKGLENETAKQADFMNTLSTFAVEHNVAIHLIAHPKKEQGIKNDYTTPVKPHLDTIKGTGALTDAADQVFWIRRDIGREPILRKNERGESLTLDETERLKMPDTSVFHLKNRETGRLDTYYFWFHTTSFQYLDYNTKPKKYITFNGSDSQ